MTRKEKHHNFTPVSDYKRAISSVKESSLGGKQFSGRKSVFEGTV